MRELFEKRLYHALNNIIKINRIKYFITLKAFLIEIFVFFSLVLSKWVYSENNEILSNELNKNLFPNSSI